MRLRVAGAVAGRERCVGVLGVVGDGPDMREVRNGQDVARRGIAPLDSRTCVIGHSSVYSSLGSGTVERRRERCSVRMAIGSTSEFSAPFCGRVRVAAAP